MARMTFIRGGRKGGQKGCWETKKIIIKILRVGGEPNNIQPTKIKHVSN